MPRKVRSRRGRSGPQAPQSNRGWVRDEARGAQSNMVFKEMLYAQSTAGGAAAIAIAPASIGGRFQEIADGFALFRVNSFRYRMHPVVSQTSSTAMGVISEFADAYPGTIATAMECLASVFLSGSAVVPTQWVEVPRRVLRGALPWYKTIAGSPDSWDETPCTLICYNSAASTNTVNIEFELDVTFRDPVPTGSTPAMMKKLRDYRMRKYVLYLLSMVDDTALEARLGLSSKGQALKALPQSKLG